MTEKTKQGSTAMLRGILGDLEVGIEISAEAARVFWTAIGMRSPANEARLAAYAHRDEVDQVLAQRDQARAELARESLDHALERKMALAEANQLVDLALASLPPLGEPASDEQIALKAECQRVRGDVGRRVVARAKADVVAVPVDAPRPGLDDRAWLLAGVLLDARQGGINGSEPFELTWPAPHSDEHRGCPCPGGIAHLSHNADRSSDWERALNIARRVLVALASRSLALVALAFAVMLLGCASCAR